MKKNRLEKNIGAPQDDPTRWTDVFVTNVDQLFTKFAVRIAKVTRRETGHHHGGHLPKKETNGRHAGGCTACRPSNLISRQVTTHAVLYDVLFFS